jgi:hypothetical protein
MYNINVDRKNQKLVLGHILYRVVGKHFSKSLKKIDKNSKKYILKIKIKNGCFFNI